MFLFFAKKWDRMENTSIKTHIFDVDACTVVLFQNILRNCINWSRIIVESWRLYIHIHNFSHIIQPEQYKSTVSSFIKNLRRFPQISHFKPSDWSIFELRMTLWKFWILDVLWNLAQVSLLDTTSHSDTCTQLSPPDINGCTNKKECYVYLLARVANI
jgi:hypothetical protein